MILLSQKLRKNQQLLRVSQAQEYFKVPALGYNLENQGMLALEVTLRQESTAPTFARAKQET